MLGRRHGQSGGNLFLAQPGAKGGGIEVLIAEWIGHGLVLS
jgi:hypothetical protein